jgi:uncharacterized cupin superfamily protein
VLDINDIDAAQYVVTLSLEPRCIRQRNDKGRRMITGTHKVLSGLLAVTAILCTSLCIAGEEAAYPALTTFESDDLDGKDLPLADPLPPEMVLTGSAENWIKYLYVGQVAVAVWQSGPQKLWLDPQSVDEFFYVLEGEVIVTNEGGDPKTFGPGDSFVLSKDFVGTWETSSTYRHLAVANPDAFSGAH